MAAAPPDRPAAAAHAPRDGLASVLGSEAAAAGGGIGERDMGHSVLREVGEGQASISGGSLEANQGGSLIAEGAGESAGLSVVQPPGLVGEPVDAGRTALGSSLEAASKAGPHSAPLQY